MENQSLKDSLQISYGATGSSPSSSTTAVCSSTLTFCVHGHKYGIATCCKDLTAERESEIAIIHPPNNPMTDSSEGLDHCHTERETGIDKKATRQLKIAAALCLLFIIIESIGSAISDSVATATDVAHLWTDFASFMISLFAIWLSSRPSTRNMSFGWHRAEIIGATVSVILIWVVTGVLVCLAILRIKNGTYGNVKPKPMLITSGIGLGINIIMGLTLHQHGHSHGRSDSAYAELEEAHKGRDGHVTDANEKEKENINVKAAFIHVVGDFVQSLGVFIAAIIIYIMDEDGKSNKWRMADPICTFISSIFVLATTISILRNTINVLMEGIPRDVDFSVVKSIIMEVDGILSVHNLRIWGLTSSKTALAAHLVIDASRSAQDVLKEASTMIRTKYDVYEMTLQVENYQQDMNNCTQCKDSV